MSKSDRIKSLEFYAYLCQKVGSEEIVKSRRLIYTIGDIAMDNNYPRISSGSKGEGLNFKGSDTDVMFIEPDFRVYESMSDVTDRWGVSLLMDTDETPPCFTYLNILPKYGVPFLFTEQLREQKNDAHHFVPELPNMHCIPTNKQKYFKYKHYLSQLLIGVNSDAISGWLLLATFFYSHKHYTEALIITDHVLSKYTDKTIPVPVETSCNIVVFHELHDNVMELMKHEKTITIVKNLTNLDINLDSKSLAVLPELQQDAQDPFMVYTCKPMAHFIRFLSYYYRGNVDAYENAFMRLLRECIDNMNNKQTGSERMGKMFQLFYTMYFLGISAQMIGESDLAKKIFRSIAICDVYNSTSAASRLSKLI
ncbi:unnamed protein product [Mytilus edulis]|uniref:Uncharacterized protein n=1 Tax=Mytilus edulis TaxID=6550 RepID=A0A8S3SNM8_MYTED|nr:unnamed protein product [Mytilus edulis]